MAIELPLESVRTPHVFGRVTDLVPQAAVFFAAQHDQAHYSPALVCGSLADLIEGSWQTRDEVDRHQKRLGLRHLSGGGPVC
jgi:hypothetical protein